MKQLAALTEKGVLVAYGEIPPPDMHMMSHNFGRWKEPGVSCRLLTDMRKPNRHCFPPPPPFALPRFFDAIRGLTGPLHFCKLDLSDAFFSIPLHNEILPFFGAWSGRQAYSYQRLPMGWTWSPFLFQTALGPLDAVPALFPGVRMLRYLDDILVVGPSAIRARDAMACVARLLKGAGFVINEKKSALEPAGTIVFLGVGLDGRGRLPFAYWPLDKAASLRGSAISMLTGDVTTHELQSVVGKLQFLCQLLPLLRAFLRSLDHEVFDRTWGSRLPATGPLTEASATSIAAFVGMSSSLPGKKAFPPRSFPSSVIVRTDASETSVGFTIVFRGKQISKGTIPLPAELIGSGSHARELYGVVAGIQEARRLVRHRPISIRSITDNSGVPSAINRGRTLSDPSIVLVGSLARDICFDENIQCECAWTPREFLDDEDALSRVIDYKHSQLPPSAMSVIRGMGLALTRDLFATSRNAQLPIFVSEHWELSASAVDAFSISWQPGDFAFPPFSLLRPFLRLYGDLVDPPPIILVSHTAPPSPLIAASAPLGRSLLAPPDFSHSYRSRFELTAYILAPHSRRVLAGLRPAPCPTLSATAVDHAADAAGGAATTHVSSDDGADPPPCDRATGQRPDRPLHGNHRHRGLPTSVLGRHPREVPAIPEGVPELGRRPPPFPLATGLLRGHTNMPPLGCPRPSLYPTGRSSSRHDPDRNLRPA